MTISVKFANISLGQYQQILDHYNEHKPNYFLVLSILDRCEGGFQIAKETKSDTGDANTKIKQLRWNRRKLDHMNYAGFNSEETILLFNALVHVFGESEVVLQH